MPPYENCGCGDRLARNEYDRHRRVFEHRRRGVAEEQLVAGAAAHAHDDEIMGAFLRFRENRVTCRHVRVDDGPYRYVTVVGHLDYISHDGLLLLTCAKGATPEKQRLEREEFDSRGFVSNLERLLLAVDQSPNGKFAASLAGLSSGAAIANYLQEGYAG